MGTLILFTTLLFLLTLTQWTNTQDLYPQIDYISGISKPGYNNNNPVTFGGKIYNLNNYGSEIPLVHNQQIAHDRSGYNLGNTYGYDGFTKKIPQYIEKKVTTYRKLPVKKQQPKVFNTVPPFKTGQLNGGKSLYKPNQGYGYGNSISIAGKGKNSQFGSQKNWGKGNNFNFNPQDFAKTVNNFNKQIEQINLASFQQKFKQERTPRLNNNEHSFVQNSKPSFDYIPVNLDSKINNFNPFGFSTDLKTNNNALNTVNGISGGHKPINLNSDWNLNKPEPIKSEPVKYPTFVPGISGFDSSSGTITNHNSQNFESFHGLAKGGDPSSFVKVNNGKVSYTYQIRHLPKKH